MAIKSKDDLVEGKHYLYYDNSNNHAIFEYIGHSKENLLFLTKTRKLVPMNSTFSKTKSDKNYDYKISIDNIDEIKKLSEYKTLKEIFDLW